LTWLPSFVFIIFVLPLGLFVTWLP
jgi:hypothetical protein